MKYQINYKKYTYKNSNFWGVAMFPIEISPDLGAPNAIYADAINPINSFFRIVTGKDDRVILVEDQYVEITKDLAKRVQLGIEVSSCTKKDYLQFLFLFFLVGYEIWINHSGDVNVFVPSAVNQLGDSAIESYLKDQQVLLSESLNEARKNFPEEFDWAKDYIAKYPGYRKFIENPKEITEND